MHRSWFSFVRRPGSGVALTFGAMVAVAQGQLTFEQPADGATFKAGAEVPVRLNAAAPDDVFPGAQLSANGTVFASAGFCCWLCPCARPIAGMATTLQIPAPHELERPSVKPWQGWRFRAPGTYVLTASATGENGTQLSAQPVTIHIEEIDLQLRMTIDADSLVRLALPEGSLFPEPLEMEMSHDLTNWTRLGPLEPGNVAAFFREAITPPDPRPRYYRAVSTGPAP